MASRVSEHGFFCKRTQRIRRESNYCLFSLVHRISREIVDARANVGSSTGCVFGVLDPVRYDPT